MANQARLKIICKPAAVTQVMQRKGLSLLDTANILGLTPANTARLLRGNTAISHQLARRVVRNFGDDAIYYTW